MHKPEKSAEGLPSWQEFQKALILKSMKDERFRAELIADPQATVERELGKIKDGLRLKSDLKIRIVERNSDELVIMLPPNDSALNDAELERIAGGLSFPPIIMGGGGPGKNSTPFIFVIQT